MSGVPAPEDTTMVATKATQNTINDACLQNELEGIISVVSWYSVCDPTEALKDVLPYYQLILVRDSTLDSAFACMPEPPFVPG